MPEAFVEVVDDSQLRERLTRAVDQFDLKRHLLTHRSDIGTSQKNSHKIIATGQITGDQRRENDACEQQPAGARECEPVCSHRDSRRCLIPNRLGEGERLPAALQDSKMVLGWSIDCKIGSQPLLVVAGTVPNDLAFDHINYVFGDIGRHVGNPLNMF